MERLLGQVEKRVLYKGSFPLIYGLTRPGAWLLRKHGYDVRRRLLYETDKQRRAGWRFIEHRVDITEFMVQARTGLSRPNTMCELIERKDIVENAPKTQRDRRVRLMAKVRIDGRPQRCPSIPTNCSDCALPEEAQPSYFMFERDRGEMPVRDARTRTKPTMRKRC